MTTVLLVLTLISLEQHAPVESAPPDASRGPAAPPPSPAVSSKGESPLSSDSEPFTFYDTLVRRDSAYPGLSRPIPKSVSRPVSPTSPAAGPFAVPLKKQPTRYTVQIAAYADRPTAETLTDRLHRKGYPSFILPHVVPKRGTWYRVRVGHFKKREEAQDMAQRLLRQERLTTYIALE
ncbi:MAG: SPOR domain-containing protein [Nitrospirae bacterium]|nr:SPOR domain-containing protein [Nitrospirota bacterium]